MFELRDRAAQHNEPAPAKPAQQVGLGIGNAVAMATEPVIGGTADDQALLWVRPLGKGRLHERCELGEEWLARHPGIAENRTGCFGRKPIRLLDEAGSRIHPARFQHASRPQEQ